LRVVLGRVEDAIDDLFVAIERAQFAKSRAGSHLQRGDSDKERDNSKRSDHRSHLLSARKQMNGLQNE